jgi:hypothetical protein
MMRIVLTAIGLGAFLAGGTVEAGVAPGALSKEKKAKAAGKRRPQAS